MNSIFIKVRWFATSLSWWYVSALFRFTFFIHYHIYLFVFFIFLCLCVLLKLLLLILCTKNLIILLCPLLRSFTNFNLPPFSWWFDLLWSCFKQWNSPALVNYNMLKIIVHEKILRDLKGRAINFSAHSSFTSITSCARPITFAEFLWLFACLTRFYV